VERVGSCRRAFGRSGFKDRRRQGRGQIGLDQLEGMGGWSIGGWSVGVLEWWSVGVPGTGGGGKENCRKEAQRAARGKTATKDRIMAGQNHAERYTRSAAPSIILSHHDSVGFYPRIRNLRSLRIIPTIAAQTGRDGADVNGSGLRRQGCRVTGRLEARRTPPADTAESFSFAEEQSSYGNGEGERDGHGLGNGDGAPESPV